MAEGKDIVLHSNNYNLVTFNKADLQEIITDNLGANGGLSQNDLDRVKIPSGGGTTWEVPSSTGTLETKELEGIIVFWKETRGYWEKSFEETGGGVAPDCSAEDALFGIGNPGGDCSKCPFAQFGSARAGDGQACKLVRHIFLVREKGILPIMVDISPGSNKAIRQYFTRLASEGIPYYRVLTRLTLEKDKNPQGITFSKVKAVSFETLTDERFAQIKDYRTYLLPALQKMTIDIDQDAHN